MTTDNDKRKPLPPIAEDPEFGAAMRRLQAKKLEGDDEADHDQTAEVLQIGIDGLVRSETHGAASAKLSADLPRAQQPPETNDLPKVITPHGDIEETGEMFVALPSGDRSMRTAEVSRELTDRVPRDDEHGESRPWWRVYWWALLGVTALLVWGTAAVVLREQPKPSNPRPSTSTATAPTTHAPTGGTPSTSPSASGTADSSAHAPSASASAPAPSVRPRPPQPPPSTAPAPVPVPPTPPTPPSAPPKSSGFSPIHPIP